MRFSSHFIIGLSMLLAGCTASVVKNVAPAEEIMIEEEALQASEATPPPTKQLAVPFASQAPLGNWDDPYQEACEEMSLLMVHWSKETKRTRSLPMYPEGANTNLLELTKWEEENGYKEDITLAELSVIAKDYFGYDARIIDDPTVDDIKREIDAGRPVIVPAAGRELGNPYFSGEGPWYHMLVITGYDRRHFITNDPGTKRGLGYRYRHDTLMNAIHDWTGKKEEIGTGERRVMVIL